MFLETLRRVIISAASTAPETRVIYFGFSASVMAWPSWLAPSSSTNV